MLFLRGGMRGRVRITSGLMRVSIGFMRGFWRWIRKRNRSEGGRGRGSWGVCVRLPWRFIWWSGYCAERRGEVNFLEMLLNREWVG